jgi:hypothetical protein
MTRVHFIENELGQNNIYILIEESKDKQLS